MFHCQPPRLCTPAGRRKTRNGKGALHAGDYLGVGEICHSQPNLLLARVIGSERKKTRIVNQPCYGRTTELTEESRQRGNTNKQKKPEKNPK